MDWFCQHYGFSNWGWKPEVRCHELRGIPNILLGLPHLQSPSFFAYFPANAIAASFAGEDDAVKGWRRFAVVMQYRR